MTATETLLAATTSPGGTAGKVPPGTGNSRGVTTIADRVVAKIASEAANEVEHTSGHRRRILGRSLGETRPKATASVDGRWARIAVDVTVDYPSPVRVVARQVREHVIGQVQALAGLEAREVDINVVALVSGSAETGRVR